MRPPAPAPLITYTKYLRRASSRSPRANSSRPLAIAVPLRPLSVIRALHRLGSLRRRGHLRGAGGTRETSRAVCQRPLTVLRRARRADNNPNDNLTPTTQLQFLINSYSACFWCNNKVTSVLTELFEVLFEFY